MSTSGGATHGSGALDWTLKGLEWQNDAACKSIGNGPFYAERDDNALIAAAKRICNGQGDIPPCPVRDACLTYALETHEAFGIWGGMSPRQRSREATERRRCGNPVKRACKVCGVKFAGPANFIVCSDECRRDAKRRRARAAS